MLDGVVAALVFWSSRPAPQTKTEMRESFRSYGPDRWPRPAQEFERARRHSPRSGKAPDDMQLRLTAGEGARNANEEPARGPR